MNYSMSAAESLNSAVAGVLTRMAVGVFATLVAAGVISALGLVPVLFSGLFGYVLIFAPLAMSLFIAFRGQSMSEGEIKLWYFGFAAVMGVSLSLIISLFTTASIVNALIGTTVSFAALAGWGYFTRRNISGWAPFLFAGVIGLIIASIANIFIASSALQMALNVICILVFLGLTAYDMNRIRDMFWRLDASEVARQQWFAALSLYINFINIFVSMLQLFGNRE
jgi:FtsH-binding integral membrane protein